MKRLICVFTVFLTLCFAAPLLAASVTLDDGTKVPLEGLTSEERKSLTHLLDKVDKAQTANRPAGLAKELVEKGPDALKLNEWSSFISGTIKTVANDLNVSVNEFIKTPVGIWAATLITYHYMGKEIISDIVDIFLVIPMWFTIMLCIVIYARRYHSAKIIYTRRKTYKNEKEKEVTEEWDPEHTTSYPWNTNDARTTSACFAWGTAIVVTIIAIVIVFA